MRAPLPGLIVHPTGIELVQKHLTCCGGKGVMHDQATDRTEFCSLSKRMGLVAALAQQICRRGVVTGQPDLLAQAAGTPITPEVTHIFLQAKDNKLKQGLGLSAGEGAKNIQVAYALALAAIWRFDIRAVVVELGHNASLDSFVLSLNQQNDRQPELVIIAGIGRLWETVRIEHFEIVIAAAYRGRLPVFACLEPFTDGKLATTANAGFRQSIVKNRIKNLREKHPFSFLSPGMRNQLASICSGVEEAKAVKRKGGGSFNKPISPEF
jgi:hypothetical protein